MEQGWQKVIVLKRMPQYYRSGKFFVGEGSVFQKPAACYSSLNKLKSL
jgi:hypothetical protein